MRNSECQYVSNIYADTNLESISDMRKNLDKKQSLLRSENLNVNNLVDSVKVPISQDRTSENLTKQEIKNKIISKDNYKTQNLTIFEKVKSKLNTSKQSYGNKQKKLLPRITSEEMSGSSKKSDLTNSFSESDEYSTDAKLKTLQSRFDLEVHSDASPSSYKCLLFEELLPATSNSDSNTDCYQIITVKFNKN